MPRTRPIGVNRPPLRRLRRSAPAREVPRFADHPGNMRTFDRPHVLSAFALRIGVGFRFRRSPFALPVLAERRLRVAASPARALLGAQAPSHRDRPWIQPRCAGCRRHRWRGSCSRAARICPRRVALGGDDQASVVPQSAPFLAPRLRPVRGDGRRRRGDGAPRSPAQRPRGSRRSLRVRRRRASCAGDRSSLRGRPAPPPATKAEGRERARADGASHRRGALRSEARLRLLRPDAPVGGRHDSLAPHGQLERPHADHGTGRRRRRADRCPPSTF